MKDLDIEYHAYEEYVDYLISFKHENEFEVLDFSYYDKDNRYKGDITISIDLLKQSHLNVHLYKEDSFFRVKTKEFKLIKYSTLSDLLCNLSYTLFYIKNVYMLEYTIILEYIKSLVELKLINWDVS